MIHQQQESKAQEKQNINQNIINKTQSKPHNSQKLTKLNQLDNINSQTHVDQIQQIIEILYNSEIKDLLNYVFSLPKSDICRICIIFDKISFKISRNPSQINNIQPTKKFTQKLIQLTRIVSKGKAIFDLKYNEHRQRYFILYLNLIDAIIGGLCDVKNQKLKDFVCKNKIFIRLFLSIDLKTYDQIIGRIYIFVVNQIQKLLLTQTQKRLVVLSIIRNLQYLVHLREAWLALKILQDLQEQSKNLISFSLLKKYNVLHNIEIILCAEKNSIFFFIAIEFCTYFLKKYKKAKDLPILSKSFQKFSITNYIKERIISSNSYQLQYFCYFLHCCPTISVTQTQKIFQHYLNEIKEVFNTYQDRDEGWCIFLIHMIIFMILRGNMQQSIGIMIKTGFFESLNQMIRKLSKLNKDQLKNILPRIMQFLDYLKEENHHFYHHYLSISFSQLKNHQMYQNNDKQYQELSINPIKKKIYNFNFDQLTLK